MRPPQRNLFLSATRRALLRGAMLATGAALLPGCGRAGTATGDAHATPDAAPVRGGRLRLGIIDGNQAGNLDAHKPIGGGTIRGFALYSKLWEWSAEMTPALALAESVETNADASAWTLRLRQGLEFHHGKTIDADDLIFSLRRLTDPALASPYAALLYSIDRNRIDKLDARTVRIHSEPGRGFVPLPDTWTNFGGIVPVDYDPISNPVGAGPYRLKSFVPGQRSLFTRFENYFKPGKPYADELEIIDFKDQTARLQALQSGQIDFINSVPADQAVLLQRDPRVQLTVSKTDGWASFDMNLERAPFDDARVRAAFRMIADRDELVARALNGQGRVANDLYAPGDPTFNGGIAQRRQDLAAARALLKQAGYDNDLSVELVAGPAGNSASSALVFAQQAKLAGVTVTVKKVDAATFAGPLRKTWPFSTGGMLAESFLATGLHADAPVSVFNKTNFRDERFGELFLRALAQPDLEQRRQLVHEAQQIQHERGGMLIWGYTNNLDAFAQRIGGAAAERTQFPAWRFENLWLRSAA